MYEAESKTVVGVYTHTRARTRTHTHTHTHIYVHELQRLISSVIQQIYSEYPPLSDVVIGT